MSQYVYSLFSIARDICLLTVCSGLSLPLGILIGLDYSGEQLHTMMSS